MLGESSFVPGLWSSSLLFFAVNCWILGIIISDHGPEDQGLGPAPEKGKDKVGTIYPREKTLKEEGVRGVEEDDSDEESDVEEIPREQTVEEMVREEMKRRRQDARTGASPTASDRQQTDVLLREYMGDIQSLVPPNE